MIFAAIFILLLISYTIFSTLVLTTPEYTLDSIYITADELRIAHLSDLHNSSFGRNNTRLLRKVRQLAPDLICFTGDLIDYHNPDETVVYQLMEGLLQIAPVFFITGNHEFHYPNSSRFLENLEKQGARFLDERITPFRIRGISFLIGGVPDTCYYYSAEQPSLAVKQGVDNLLAGLELNRFTLLLSHKPEYFRFMAAHDVELVLAGHTHGGMFRLPFLGGIYLPLEDYVTSYDAGLYQIDKSTMLVSRGLGSSLLPFRFYNYPEILLVRVY